MVGPGAGGAVVGVVDGGGVFEVVGDVVDPDDSGDVTTRVVVGVALPVVDVVMSAVVGGEVSTAMVGGVVVGAVVAGTVVPELAVPCLSPELVIGRAISTAPMPRRIKAAAATSNGARQLVSAVISRPVRS